MKTKVQVTEELLIKFQMKMAYYVTMANIFAAKNGLPSFNTPTYEFNLYGTVSGKASLKAHHCMFHAVIYMENVEKYLETTLPHELAHLVASVWYGHRGHGFPWEKVMDEVFKAPVKRYHTYNVANVVTKKQHVHLYTCNCNKTFKLKTTTHNRIKTGQRKYFCKACKSTLRLMLQEF
jgi:SprT protein